MAGFALIDREGIPDKSYHVVLTNPNSNKEKFVVEHKDDYNFMLSDCASKKSFPTFVPADLSFDQALQVIAYLMLRINEGNLPPETTVGIRFAPIQDTPIKSNQSTK